MSDENDENLVLCSPWEDRVIAGCLRVQCRDCRADLAIDKRTIMALPEPWQPLCSSCMQAVIVKSGQIGIKPKSLPGQDDFLREAFGPVLGEYAVQLMHRIRDMPVLEVLTEDSPEKTDGPSSPKEEE